MDREYVKNMRVEIEQFLVDNGIEYNQKTSTKNLLIKAQKDGFEPSFEIDQEPEKPAKAEKIDKSEQDIDITIKPEKPVKVKKNVEPESEQAVMDDDDDDKPEKKDHIIWYALAALVVVYIVKIFLNKKPNER